MSCCSYNRSDLWDPLFLGVFWDLQWHPISKTEKIYSFFFILQKTLGTSDSRGPFFEFSSSFGFEVQKMFNRAEKFYQNNRVQVEEKYFSLYQKPFSEKGRRGSLALNVSFQTKKNTLTLSLNVIECRWRCGKALHVCSKSVISLVKEEGKSWNFQWCEGDPSRVCSKS
jgi:hypothetical protein